MRARCVVLGAVGLVACKPDLPLDDGLITEPRVVAVKSEPAEAKPGTPLTYTALVAAPLGSPGAGAISWSFCTAPKPPTEDNVVASACLGDDALLPAGEGEMLVASTPRNACSLFGPDTPPGGFRPRDPDITGGYYQPLRIQLGNTEPVFQLERILCDLGGAPADLANEFTADYLANQNPHLAPLDATVDGRAIALDAVPRGAVVALRAAWGPEDAESYAYFDRSSQTISTRREAMRVAWYVTGGQLGTESNGRGESDPASSVGNTWTAPSAPGQVTLWVVLRDARGGVDFATYDLNVAP